MLGILREVGMPPLIVGAMKHALKGISEEQVRDMCKRVAVGMLNISIGGDVRESLAPDTLLDDETMIRMVEVLRGLGSAETRALSAG
jgi:hypothetical protein